MAQSNRKGVAPSKAKGKASLNANKGKQQVNRSSNLAANRAWLGFEWLKPLGWGPLNLHQDIGTAQVYAMNQNRKELAISCVWLSLLAHAGSTYACEWLASKRWGIVQLERVPDLVAAFCRANETTICLWDVIQDGTNANLAANPLTFKPKRVNPMTPTVHVALVTMDWGFHMVPLQKPDYKVVVKAGPISGDASVGADVSTSSSSLPPSPPVAPTPVEPEPTPTTAGVPPPEFSDLGKLFGVGPSGPIAKPVRVVTFDGIHAPPACWKWRRGCWSSTGTSEATLSQVLPMLRPDVVSATEEYALSYLDLVLYLPVEIQPPLFLAKRRTVTDGNNVARFFLEGDVIRAGSSSYIARPVRYEGRDLLALVRNTTSLFGILAKAIRDRVPFINSATSVVLETNGEVAVEDESKQSALWAMVVNTTKEPIEIAALSRFRNSAAAQGYGKEAVKADDASNWVRERRRHYPALEGVGGRFQWGYCYSCGKELPGTFKSRLCHHCGQRKNSSLGRMVADGLKVTSAASRVVYPGVVNTTSRHPPLKEAESFATDQNFRLAPSALRGSSPSPPLRDAARA
jgi:hypothetical protein